MIRSLAWAGIRAQVSSDAPAHVAFLERYCGPILCDGGQPPDIELTARWIRGLFARSSVRRSSTEAATYDVIGSGTWAAKHALVKHEKVRKRRCRFEFALDEPRFRGTMVFQERGLRQAFSRLDDSLLAHVNYYMVCYPIFWYLETFRDVHVLHAAAMRIRGRTVLIFGLDGVGKTMLTLGLMRRPETEFIADNLALFDGSRVFATWQPVKVRHRDAWRIPPARFIHAMRCQLRTFLQPRAVLAEHVVERGVLLLPYFSQQPTLEMLGAQEGLDLIQNLNSLPDELEHYEHYVHLLNILGKKPPLGPQRRQALSTLLQRLTIYRVGMGAGEPFERVLERINEVLN